MFYRFVVHKEIVNNVIDEEQINNIQKDKSNFLFQ